MQKFVHGWLALMVFALVSLLSVPGARAAQPRTYTIAVVKDGPAQTEFVLDLIAPELEHMLGSNASFRLKQSPEFDAGWEFSRIPEVINAALADPEVDLILGIGNLVTQVAAGDDLALSKPFVSALATLGDVPYLPYSPEDFSLKSNFSFAMVPFGEDEAFRTFKRMTGMKSLHIGVDPIEMKHVVGLDDALKMYAEDLDLTIVPIAVGTEAEPVLTGLGSEVEGFLLTTLPRLDTEERQALIAGLNSRRIPTYSTQGETDLERGVLASNLQSLHRQNARRIASNIQQILTGVEVRNLPVFLVPKSRLQVNGQTAAAIGFKPNFETRLAAEILYPEALEAAYQTLTLAEVFPLAEQGNVDLTISDMQVETTLRGKQVLRAGIYPQVLADGSYLAHNYKGIESLFPEQMGTVSLALNQMIYNDRTISNFRAADRLYESRTFQRETQRLDILELAGKRFLDLVLARLFYGVEMDNLRLTEMNLEIARTRVEVGQAGRDEVFRWEAEVAQRQGRLMTSEALVEKQRIALNQTLGLSQDRYWRPVEIEVATTGIPLFDGRLDIVIDSPEMYNRFREAVVLYALQHDPELEQYYKEIEAHQIRVGQRKRSFFLPQVGLSLNHDFNVYNSDDTGVKRDGTMFMVTAQLPIFEGTRRAYDVKRLSAVQRRTERELEQVRQFVERRARTMMSQLESSYPNLRFARTAAEKSRLNFEVVREKYANGIVNITQLLEAQNAAFSAQLQSAAADYIFLKDLVSLQRVLAFYADEHTVEEQDVLLTEINALMDSQ